MSWTFVLIACIAAVYLMVSSTSTSSLDVSTYVSWKNWSCMGLDVRSSLWTACCIRVSLSCFRGQRPRISSLFLMSQTLFALCHVVTGHRPVPILHLLWLGTLWFTAVLLIVSLSTCTRVRVQSITIVRLLAETSTTHQLIARVRMHCIGEHLSFATFIFIIFLRFPAILTS